MYVPTLVLLGVAATASAVLPVLLGPQPVYRPQAPVLQLASPSYNLQVPYPGYFSSSPVHSRVYSDASGGSFVVVTDDSSPGGFVHETLRSGGYTRNFVTSNPAYSAPREYPRRPSNQLDSFDQARFRSSGPDRDFRPQGSRRQPPAAVPGPSFGSLPTGRQESGGFQQSSVTPGGQPFGPRGPGGLEAGAYGPAAAGRSGPGGFQQPPGPHSGPEARDRQFGPSSGLRPGSAGFNQPQGPQGAPEARGRAFGPSPDGRPSGFQPSGPQGAPDVRARGEFQQGPVARGPGQQGPGVPSLRDSQIERRPDESAPQVPNRGFPAGPGQQQQQQAFSVNFEGSGFGYGYMVHGDDGPHPGEGSPQGRGGPTPPPQFGRPNSVN